MNAEIKPGDVVQPKSGGPKMTVSLVDKDGMGTLSAWCDWFEGSKKMEGVFPVTSVKTVAV